MAGKCGSYWRSRNLGKECGAPTKGQTKAYQDAYQYELVPDLVAMGAKEDDIYDLLKYTSCIPRGSYYRKYKTIPFLSLRRDSPIRKRMLDFFFEQIMKGKTIRSESIALCGFTRKEWTDEDYCRHFLPKSYGHHKNGCKVSKNMIITRNINSLKKGDGIPPPHSFSYDGNKGVTQKRTALNTVCTAGQIGILQAMNNAGYGDDEYTAFCIALKWAIERLEQEKITKEK